MRVGGALRYDVFVVGAGTLVLALGLCATSIADRRKKTPEAAPSGGGQRAIT